MSPRAPGCRRQAAKPNRSMPTKPNADQTMQTEAVAVRRPASYQTDTDIQTQGGGQARAKRGRQEALGAN